ncbi:MAG: DUF5615 family PIN-like protein [Chloroflexi bacterium]|nr:DUF5615 family PIN-like protein [Chloroflexota bacterium]
MKFLTDTQTSALFVKMLRDLGWDVETVYEHGIAQEKDDGVLVAFARTFDLVFVTFDLLQKEPGARVNREIRERGGKVITIFGGPDQPPERALGRLLFAHPDWYPFLEKHDGRVDIRDLKNPKLLSRSKLRGGVRGTGEKQFNEYVDKREAAKKQPIRRRRRPKPVARQQSHMDIGAAS